MQDSTLFEDFSPEVKEALQSVVSGWLGKWAQRMEKQAQSARSEARQDSPGYQSRVLEGQSTAVIGSDSDQALWEEFGTGTYADAGKNGGRMGRRGWWVYREGWQGGGGDVLTEEQAKTIEETSGGALHATRGSKPNYTLEKAFLANKEQAKYDLAKQLRERMNQ